MAGGFYTDKQGRVRPISGKSGTVVTAGVLAIGLFAVGGGGGLLSAEGIGATGSGVSARKSEGQKAARKGDPDEAWRRMGMRKLKQTLRQDAECLTTSHGEVQEFFLHTPCTSLDRILLTVGDEAGNSAVISVAWVAFRTTSDRRDFKTLIDRPGSGDVYPLGNALLGLADIHFSGLNYGTDTKGTSLTVAEAETATGFVDHDTLDALAEVAAYLPGSDPRAETVMIGSPPRKHSGRTRSGRMIRIRDASNGVARGGGRSRFAGHRGRFPDRAPFVVVPGTAGGGPASGVRRG
ncbi:hypothetical protein [Umezawaea sp. Da 62-37]|uniref:hypothetical protein n=1 Tax=Umezawaea sp. Da 62-37 TaxID=3075927 RepID=UPI0028F6FA08|nr:hypothetical protein [Umezawaea sp. Da 62-37]WNV88499.1 hypothetical protein RM788_09435 [Umezawaea sp. Da 62-37]